jgi:multidrug efflux pump
MKSFTDIFVRRPVLAMVVSFVIVIAGLQAIKTLNVRQYPRSENAAITVRTVYVGASADLVRGFITSVLERAIAAADGIDYLQSTSQQGASTITARLRLNYDSNKALSQISAQVESVRLSPGRGRSAHDQTEQADSCYASAYLSFTSNILEPNQVTDYLVRIVQPRLSAIPGVQAADILGGRTFAMRIWLKPDRMAALNVSPAQVRQALAANNYLAAVGQTKGSLVKVNLTANTDLHTAGDFKQLVIRQENGKLVRLSDIADVVLGAEDYDTEVRYSQQRAVFMGIRVLPNANQVDVIKRARVELEQIKNELPTGMEAGVAYDATAYINDAMHEVFKTFIETLAIVMVVIFLFLGSWRSVLAPIVAIPVSLIGAVFLMQVFGFTLNLLTLLAIVLSVGLVVDDAIVVVENVERHLREGMRGMDAALLGARELITPIIAMTITLAAVYTPIGLQGGLTGSLFREFALTLAGAVFISGIVALTLSPMICSKLLHRADAEKGFSGLINRNFDRFRNAYGRVLDRTLRVRPAVYAVWIGLALLTVPMFTMSQRELAPTEDQGVIFGFIDSPANATLDQLQPFADAAGKVFHSFQKPISRSRSRRRTRQLRRNGLKPWGIRTKPTKAFVGPVMMGLMQIPGIEMFPLDAAGAAGCGLDAGRVLHCSTAEPSEFLSWPRN